MNRNKLLLSIFTILSLISFLVTPLSAKNPIRTIEGTAIQVSDGDTFKMETAEGTKLKVRLYGIDAPETAKYSHRTGKISKPGQPYGDDSHKALEERILRKKVKVEIIDMDKYKRMVGITYVDGRNINLEMVKEGLAWAYRKYLDRPYASEYIDAEEEAKEKKAGLWEQSNPQPPWEFRKLMRVR